MIPSKPTLAVCAIDTRTIDATRRAVKQTLQTLDACYPASCVYWISHNWTSFDWPVATHQIQISPIEQFPLDYNRVTLNLLPQLIKEDFVLIVQADGFAVNPQSWSDQFLSYDYIGAVMNPVWVPNRDHAVGNGGFCLRSRRLLNALREINIEPTNRNEDTEICCAHRLCLEQQYGIRWAPQELAHQFSIEWIVDNPWLGKSFGFHGRHVQHHYDIDLLRKANP